jgi:hypothetical protein
MLLGLPIDDHSVCGLNRVGELIGICPLEVIGPNEKARSVLASTLVD